MLSEAREGAGPPPARCATAGTAVTAVAVLVVSASPPLKFGGGTTEARAAEAAWAASSARHAAALAVPVEADVEVASPLLVLVPVVDAIDGGEGWG